MELVYGPGYRLVSTLLEILVTTVNVSNSVCRQCVSTLLEILVAAVKHPMPQHITLHLFQPFLRFWGIDVNSRDEYGDTVSTLLEILGLVCSVLVGF